MSFYCCRGRDRTSTRQLAVAQSLSAARTDSVVDPGRLLRDGSTLRLSCYPHCRIEQGRIRDGDRRNDDLPNTGSMFG